MRRQVSRPVVMRRIHVLLRLASADALLSREERRLAIAPLTADVRAGDQQNDRRDARGREEGPPQRHDVCGEKRASSARDARSFERVGGFETVGTVFRERAVSDIYCISHFDTSST